MSRATNARIAGATLILYIVTGIAALVIMGPVSQPPAIADKLAAFASESWRVRVALLLAPLMFCYAVILGVTLRALTREDDSDLAEAGMVFRVAEGTIGLALASVTAALLWLATSGLASGLDPASVGAVAAALTRIDRMSTFLSAFAFSIGSLCFSLVFVRARSLPPILAWLGVVASALLVVALPLQLAGLSPGGTLAANLVWLPMLVFEVWLAVRLLGKGEDAIRSPHARASASVS